MSLEVGRANDLRGDIVGSDFHAVFPHELDLSSIGALPLTLTNALSGIAPPTFDTSSYRRAPIRGTWEWEEPVTQPITMQFFEDAPFLFGPHALSVSVAARELTLSNGMRWRVFAEHADVREWLRTACCAIGRSLGAPVVIYGGDWPYELVADMLGDGASIEVTLAALSKEFGPPPVSADAIGDGTYTGYFMDLIDAERAPLGARG